MEQNITQIFQKTQNLQLSVKNQFFIAKFS